MASDKLSPQQRLFVEKYIENGGNAYQAGLDANYSESWCKSKAFSKIKEHKYQRYLETLYEKTNKESVATREEILTFWTETFKDKKQNMKTRLDASDKLAKAFCMYTEKKEIDANVNGKVVFCTDIDDIED